MNTWWIRLSVRSKYWISLSAGLWLSMLALEGVAAAVGIGAAGWGRFAAAAGIAFVLSLAAGLGLAALLASRIEALARAVESGASGDAFEIQGEDEIAQIALAAVMGGGAASGGEAPREEFRQAAQRLVQLARSAAQEAARNAGGGGEQSAQIEQVAAAIEEMSATIVQVAQNTSEAHRNADDACRTAREGGDVVGRAVGGMRKIHEQVNSTAQTIRALGASSEKIGEIVDVIYDIADQTNLLALNAAIEAARVGEQGRGFAVVADEVRKLAERTTRATKEIAEVIKGIQDRTAEAVQAMDAGTKAVAEEMELARRAGESLSRIVEQVQLVTDKVQHIAAATEEQSATAHLISTNMEQAAQLTRQSSEWGSRCSRQLNDLGAAAQELDAAMRASRAAPAAALRRAA